MLTTEPFLIGEKRYCTLCAERLDGEAVSQRAMLNWRREQRLDRPSTKRWSTIG